MSGMITDNGSGKLARNTRTEPSLRNFITIEEKSTTNNFDAADRAVNAGLKGVKLLALKLHSPH